jgi:hypothetical protein
MQIPTLWPRGHVWSNICCRSSLLGQLIMAAWPFCMAFLVLCLKKHLYGAPPPPPGRWVACRLGGKPTETLGMGGGGLRVRLAGKIKILALSAILGTQNPHVHPRKDRVGRAKQISRAWTGKERPKGEATTDTRNQTILRILWVPKQ